MVAVTSRFCIVKTNNEHALSKAHRANDEPSGCLCLAWGSGRAEELAIWLHRYNRHRPHGGL